jgi:histidinol-phosphate/aromatic aminotransferase/cobyric acid decarboxylase-like protein
VNALAQAAGIAALADHDHWARSHAAVVAARSYLMDALCRLELSPLPTAANFVLLPTGSGRTAGFPTGATLRRALLDHGCCVRDAASFGLPQHVRIGVRTIAECRRLAAAFEAVLS